jgi:hypothetical protein
MSLIARFRLSLVDCLIAATVFLSHASFCRAAEIQVIYPGLEPDLAGKEVDWIYGDYVMSNDQISLVIAAPIATRDANLTVRQIGGSILDLTLRRPNNDQLSAFIPTAARYLFHDPTAVETGREGNSVFWRCRSSSTAAGDGTSATLTYRLTDGQPFAEASIRIEGDKAADVKAYDGVRADRTFEFASQGKFAFCQDHFFRQTIGFACPDSQEPPQWKVARPALLRYSTKQVRRAEDSLTWSVRLYPATSPLDLSATEAAMQTIEVKTSLPEFEGQTVLRAELTIEPKSGQTLSAKTKTIRTDDRGVASCRLQPGRYRVSAESIGLEPATRTIEVTETSQTFDIELDGFSGLIAKVTDGQGAKIPVKAVIYQADGRHPDYGPDSTRTFIKNCVYSVHGSMRCPLPPGKYEVVFSHGPEFNQVTKQIEIRDHATETVRIKLDRVVDTSGWVSTELHSHSSPSGDNTSDQFGRVENLLCEHLEFAPCTEHNRVSSYVPHLQTMNMTEHMATCSGIELTGSPLPVNHQNAFPLHHHPHTQNGGGPRTDANPVVQIERLAMWDGGSEKVVQMNHPNLHQIFGDLDVDGVPDSGFREMLNFADVIEVHPLETIFQDVAANPPNVREMRIPIFQWMQLLNNGLRTPGVVNTDAHYNHHGSGGLRNWFACSTDDPAKISTEEMVKQAEAGHIIMSTGPFLKVEGYSTAQDRIAIPGDDLKAADGKVRLKVNVQCPNWLDVNRVQIFINGRPSEPHNRTRKNAPDSFGPVDEVVKFDGVFELELDSDAHLIVATIGEGMTMQKVMGESKGKRPPIAVSNPIFVDVDGNGFDHNHDELGLPLPRQK